MTVGKIVWFGGKNSKTGKINDFGYIFVDDQEEDIKFFREDVPIELQNILERDRKKGKGYPIQFDIKTFREGNKTKRKAVNIKPITQFGLFISFKELISQDNIKYIINIIKLSNKGKIVEFITENGNVNILRQVNLSEMPEEVVRKFCENNDHKITKKFVSQYLSVVDDVNAIEYIFNKIERLSPQEASDFFALICTNHDHLFLISDQLRQQLKELNLTKYAQLLEKKLWTTDEGTQGKLWAEIADIIHLSNVPASIFRLLQVYLSNIGTDEAVKFISEKVKILEQTKIKDFLYKVFEHNQDIFLKKQDLHPYLKEYNFNQYLTIVQKILESDDQILSRDVFQDLINFLANCSYEKQLTIWQNISYLEGNLEYHGYLWNIAPLEYKQKIIEAKYSEFFRLVEEFKHSEYHCSQYISKDYRELYDFDKSDKELAGKWGNNAEDNFIKAQMLSARGAEKLVQYFYQNTESYVEDIAVHQLSSKSSNWKKADIYVAKGNSQKWIDVKNFRRSINSNYSEFCIQKFKEHAGHDIVIAGVLSPYLQFQFLNKEGGNFYVDNPVYLGEISHSQLNMLTKKSSNDVIKLDMTRGFDPKSYLPPWLFDYDQNFYQNQIRIADKLRTLDKNKIPDFEDIKIFDSKLIYDYLPIFIFANLLMPLSWTNKMPKWVKQIVKMMYREETELLRLSDLHIIILRHFLTNLSQEDSGYSPSKVLRLLGNPSFPFKIYDPLEIIKDFCNTLQIVWENRLKANLTGFKIFKFHGRGLLSGKYSESDSKETTILAYCGGKIEGKGSCGKSPLILGREKPCLVCGKLICPGTHQNYCGFCSYKDFFNKILCQGAIKRKSEHQKNSEHNSRSNERYSNLSDIDF
jgi:hypothetical protein